MCCFADAHASYLEWLLSGRSSFPWFLAFFLLFVSFVQPLVTDSYIWLTFVKLRMLSRYSCVWTLFFLTNQDSCILQPRKWLQICIIYVNNNSINSKRPTSLRSCPNFHTFWKLSICILRYMSEHPYYWPISTQRPISIGRTTIITTFHFLHTIMLSFHFTSLTQSCYHFTSLSSHNHVIIIWLLILYTIMPFHHHYSDDHVIIISLPTPHTTMPSSFHFPFFTQLCIYHFTFHSLHIKTTSFHFMFLTQSCQYNFTSLSLHNHAIILSLPILYTTMPQSTHLPFRTQPYHHHLTSHSLHHTIITSLPILYTIPLSPHFPFLTPYHYHLTSHSLHHTTITSLPIPYTIPLSPHFPFLTPYHYHLTSHSLHHTIITSLPIPYTIPSSPHFPYLTPYHHHLTSHSLHHTTITSLPIPYTIPLSPHFPFLTQPYHHHLTTHSLHHPIITSLPIPYTIPLSPNFPFLTPYHHHLTTHSLHHPIITSLPIPYTIPLSPNFPFLTPYHHHLISQSLHHTTITLLPIPYDCLVGLVVRRPPREWKIPGLNPACAGIFSGSSHTSDLNIGTPVATLPGAWRYRGQHWSAQCQYTVTGWDRTFDLQLLSQCGST